MEEEQDVEEEEEEEEEDFDDFLEEDEWEDTTAYQELLEKMPNGWYMIKIKNFSKSKLVDIDEWCGMNCHNKYERVGWYSGCAYTVGMQFESSKDAVLFTLMWS